MTTPADSANLYKILLPGRLPCHGGSGAWPPPGEWRQEAGPLRPCEAGTLHLCGVEDLPAWLVQGGEIWEAEADGAVVVGHWKVGCLRARLVEAVGVLTREVIDAVAAEAIRLCCAVVRRRLARDWQGDGRPEAALQAAEAVAAALVGGAAADVAASASAAAASASAAGDAAWVGESVAGAAALAAGDAALVAKDAAWVAARVAGDAARDVGAAVGVAARDAGRAAGDAGDAARRWLGGRLLAHLAGDAPPVDYAAVAAGWVA